MSNSFSNNRSFPVKDFENVKLKVLNWIQQFDTFCFLDNNRYAQQHHTLECIWGAGVKKDITADAGNALVQLQDFISGTKGELFGHLNYDLKNELEALSSDHEDYIGFPDLYFFQPQIIIRLSEEVLSISGKNPDDLYNDILRSPVPVDKAGTDRIRVHSKISKEKYIDTVNRLKEHILRGDCYEINFCQEFFSRAVTVNPLQLYQKLTTVSPNPFSALYRMKDKWLVCASPERYIKIEGNKIISQPIKGTSVRNINDSEKDWESRNQLAVSSKDRSENVMVVDLVRNDLSKVCVEGSVKVDELFGIYTFPQVHQMISTISGTLKSGINFTDIIRASFPMGSMTGAPKKRVMELIEQYERTKRGIFSGAVGYIDPDGNADFNVVIRSILYNAAEKYLSFLAGSGITFYSDAEKEWEECMMKVAAMREVLNADKD